MIIDCVSDLHGFFPRLEGGDLLIVAGDLTSRDLGHEYFHFLQWINGCNYKKKVVVAGNHDGLIAGGRWKFAAPEGIDYLCDSGTEFEGLKIWGSPYTPTFGDWHFMAERGEEIQKHWDMIPDNTDILITHGPPCGILDKTLSGEHAGCECLLLDVCGRVLPKLHVFGHIHEAYGEKILNDIHFINCSIMNERYQPINKPIRVIL